MYNEDNYPHYRFQGNYKCTTPYYQNDVQLHGYPCGSCPACMNVRKMKWINRMRMETIFTKLNTLFVTTTYADTDDFEGNYRNIQLMIKRIRNDGYKIRYVFTTEYGSKNGRVHHHGVIWTNYPWTKWLKPKLANEEFSEKYWKLGFVKIRPGVLARGPGYISYCIKYITKDNTKMVSSNSPRIGQEGITWMKNAIKEMHKANKFKYINDIPQSFNVTILRKRTKIVITNEIRRELKEELNIPYANIEKPNVAIDKISANIEQNQKVNELFMKARKYG